MIRLNALRHLLDPVGHKGNQLPFDISFIKLSTGEIISGRCTCLSSDFFKDTLNIRFVSSGEIRTIHFSLIKTFNKEKVL